MNPENDAAVLFGAMVFGMGADGKVTDRERTALNLLGASVPELRGVSPDALLPKALAALHTAGAQPEWLRRKALALGIEVMVRGNSGEFDPAGLKGLAALRGRLRVDEEFTAAALFPLRCKYTPGDIDDEVALTIVAAMLAVAAADGEVSPAELGTISKSLQLVPQFESRDPMMLLTTAGKLVPQAVERVTKLERFRDKTYVLCAEVAHAGGNGPKAQAMLATLEKSMKVTEKVPAQAAALFGARYGKEPAVAETLAGTAWAGKLIAPDGVRFFEFALRFDAIAGGKVTATMDWGKNGGLSPLTGTLDGNRLSLVDKDGDKKELTVDRDRITGTDKGGACRIEAARSHASTHQLAAELAGFYAAHALCSVEGGGPLTPLVGEERAGQQKLNRFAANDLTAGVAAAQQHFEQNAGHADRAVLVVDGFITLSGVKKDALLVTIADHAGGAKAQMAVPFRHKSPGAQFAVHKPKILSADAGVDTAAVSQAFFRGVDRHTQGAALWNAHLDQSF